MSKKKTKKRNAGPPLPMIRLSQCIIVKNEEKNIEKALGWAKGVAFEQIVVDTGSTDRTVEIAEKMGARVYHFEWINDFAAAKNYAIEQAKGNWIAFLDADEYFIPEDTRKMIAVLKQIHSDPQMREQFLALNCPWVQLDDNGQPFGVDEQTRLFRNTSSVRYVGRIHEKLSLKLEEVVKAENFSIMHTGYARTSYTETGKAERNVTMLRVEIADRPDDMDLKVYLADALRGKAREDGPEAGNVSEDEAEALYAEAAAYDGPVDPMLNKKAHLYTVAKSVVSGKPVAECEMKCLRALRIFPGDIDFEYYHAKVLIMRGDYRAAWEVLQGCEANLVKPSAIHKSTLVAMQPSLLFTEMVYAAQGIGDTAGSVKYATMVLVEDKARVEMLGPLIATLIDHGSSDDDVIALLGKIYNMSDPGDVMLIARAAKDSGALDFARKIVGLAGKIMGG